MDHSGAPSDGSVVRAVLSGDVDQFSVLVRRYRDRYARYAAHMLGSIDAAEDAVQDAMVRAYTHLAQCREPDNFAGWFFLILRNRCFAERRRTRWESDFENIGEVAAPEQTESALERSEVVRDLQRALQRLTAEQREVFVLKHVEGLSYEEIAGRLSTSVAALKMRMHRAYDRLRELLEAP